jgi:hypothetical protein
VEELSKAIPALLSTALSRGERFDMVEREQLTKVLGEQALGMSGLVNPEEAARIGQLLGAKMLVTLKAFVVDRQAFVTANVINTETGRIRAVSRSTLLARPDINGMCSLLAGEVTRVSEGLLTKAAASEDEKMKELIARLQKVVGKGPKPAVTIIVPEEHLRRPIPDPAVATQLSYLLRKLRFTVIENQSPELEKWVRDYFGGRSGRFPSEILNVDVVIYGGAFSEAAGTAGNFVSVRARVELTAINVKNGEVVAVNRGTGSAADLSENVAAKASLEKATSACMEEFLTEMIQGWNGDKTEKKTDEK